MWPSNHQQWSAVPPAPSTSNPQGNVESGGQHGNAAQNNIDPFQAHQQQYPVQNQMLLEYQQQQQQAQAMPQYYSNNVQQVPATSQYFASNGQQVQATSQYYANNGLQAQVTSQYYANNLGHMNGVGYATQYGAPVPPPPPP
eukprot:CAMPEP_0181103770 /NCGR_PEP_ID=MMETSP1071-20121207/15054_1 /TAXON_ID=35127 /ORGANISM="Thalassiosira sp., Strain NH16" /LENGTH=141 /DNA_ID=CAMNT_0023186889 /DNA_START=582 /DNA_END=1003 /DNA_ORIENTATION=-